MDELRRFLEHARQARTLVRLIRATDEDGDHLTGFVVGVGPDLVALHQLSHRVDLDGYTVVRLEDVAEHAVEFPSAPFYRRALEMKGEAPVVPPGLDLSSLPAAVESVARHHPLVVLHFEDELPDEAAVGQVREVTDAGLHLVWITPRAEWEADDRLYGYASISRLEFAGEYERTLAMVAGPPPEHLKTG